MVPGGPSRRAATATRMAATTSARYVPVLLISVAAVRLLTACICAAAASATMPQSSTHGRPVRAGALPLRSAADGERAGLGMPAGGRLMDQRESESHAPHIHFTARSQISSSATWRESRDCELKSEAPRCTRKGSKGRPQSMKTAPAPFGGRSGARRSSTRRWTSSTDRALNPAALRDSLRTSVYSIPLLLVPATATPGARNPSHCYVHTRNNGRLHTGSPD